MLIKEIVRTLRKAAKLNGRAIKRGGEGRPLRRQKLEGEKVKKLLFWGYPKEINYGV